MGRHDSTDVIATEKPAEIFAALSKLASISAKGSVITKDNYISILIKLLPTVKYAEPVFGLLNKQLRVSAVNQLPMYAEQAYAAIPKEYKASFITTLTNRMNDFDKESKRKWVEKVLKKLSA